MKRLRVAVAYNSYEDGQPETGSADSGSDHHLRLLIRSIARALRGLGHDVSVIHLGGDLSSLQRRLDRLCPDVVFNQYDDVVHGALYEMRFAAFIRMLGYPITGSPALGLGLSRDKHMALSLLKGAGIPIPADTTLVERVSDVARRKWHFPLIVHAAQEHAGIGMARNSVVWTKKALREKAREVIASYNQPALVQRFLPGREFNVSVLGGRRPQVLPLAEVDYSRLPSGIPPIMSYAAKWVETSVEFRRTRVICPAKVKPALAELIGETAVKAFRTVGGWGYGRVDIRLDEEEVPRVLEVNCNPCLDRDMGLARSAERAGIRYPELLQRVIKAAFEGPPYDMFLPIFARKPGRGAPPPALSRSGGRYRRSPAPARRPAKRRP
jgi:D-alanine-D-alanine ligase